MIRINLIFDRKTLEVSAVKRELAFAGIITLLILLICVVFLNMINIKISTASEKVEEAEAKKKELAVAGKKLKEFKEAKKRLDKRINAITSLLALKNGPARIFDELNNLLATEIWLDSISESNGNIRISGFSFSNPGIAVFMDNIKNSKYFSNVELMGIDQTSIDGEVVKRFSLNASIIFPAN